MGYRSWDGTEWQDYCIVLLRRRYPDHTLQEVPDRHLGDLGIEAFSHDGCVFQCYAAEEPLAVKALYEAQRDKLTADLSKLTKNAIPLGKMLGDLVIKRYVFMVHRNDSRKIVEHASLAAELVRSWNLDFIDPDFRIVVVTDDYYAAERDELFAIPEQLVSAEPPSQPEVEAWASENSGLVGNVHRKLGAVGLTGAGLDAYTEQIASAFLEGENALQQLRAKSPDRWQAVVEARSRKERRLALLYPPATNTGSAVVVKVADEFAQEIHRDSPSISATLSDTLAWSAVADWLMRCPLDMQEPS